jgi:predicted DNA-binding antitoxin AbrB/MazE fold protein
MGSIVRARVRNGGLELVDKVDLAEGTEVELTISEIPSDEDIKKSRCAAGGGRV